MSADTMVMNVASAPNEVVRVVADWLREHHAETYSELADALGISDSYLNNIRSHHKAVSSERAREMIDAWAEHYGLDVVDLLTAEHVERSDESASEDIEVEPEPEEEPEPKPATRTFVTGPQVQRDRDRIDVAHGELYFRANRGEDGIWEIHGRLDDDEAVRLLSMAMYRKLFSTNGVNPEHEETEE